MPTTRSSAITIQVPLRGQWIAMNPPGHHPLARDFIAVDDRDRPYPLLKFAGHLFGRISSRSTYTWGQPVLAPFPGVVRTVAEGWPDRPDLNLARDIIKSLVLVPRLTGDDYRPYAGNFIVLEGENCFAMLAHLRRDSARVTRGQRVEAGEALAELGNSGKSIQPHLHLQLMTSSDPFRAELVPFVFERFEQWTGSDWKFLENTLPEMGKRFRSAPETQSPDTAQSVSGQRVT